jgi:hypothetical protein
MATEGGAVGRRDDGGDGHGFLGFDTAQDAGQFRPRFTVHALDEDIEDSSAGESYGEGVIVAHAVRLEARRAIGQHLLAEVVERSLDAAAAHGADRLTARRDDHRGARWPWR